MNSTKAESPESEKKSIFTRTIIDIKELDKVLKKNSNHGLCGGHNLGNTCFMNSSIACLSNCIELTTYFLTGKYKSDINKSNKEGLGGKLANAWNSLLEEYWNSSNRTGNPSEVKGMVARKVRKFGGFSQQDSNEFMTEFLSLLSEDLNKSKKKEYIVLKEKQENESEYDCAKRFWDLHLKNNDSIITDLFSGLFRSEVCCSNCNYKNITFDPFNTLILDIPSFNSSKIEYLNKFQIFYIPKYSIRKNCGFKIKANINDTVEDIIKKIKTIKDFKYNLQKLKFIKVLDSKLEEFKDEKDLLKNGDYIFIFDDMSKEGEKNNIIPLYFYENDKISAFPRLLFLEENINFGQLKRKIFYFARKCFTNPLKEEKNEIEQELIEYIEKKEEYDEQKLWNLFDKEYNEIFETNEKKFELFDDFPYKIIIKKNIKDDEEICLFDGKNKLENLKQFEIEKDEDFISNLLNKILNNELCINLVFQRKSSYLIPKLNFNSFESFIYKEELNLYSLLNYFSMSEQLDKNNEWKCGNCKKKVSASKKLSIYYVPRLLIICLKRFKKQNSYYYSKNNEYIDFPLENLDMGKYICGPDKDHSIYDLFAVSQHYGDTGGGHYTAICKNGGKWYNYNDSSCSSSSPANVTTSSAYVLFYRRRNW